jgi:hypothetical protein
MNRSLLTLKIGRSDDFPDTALSSINPGTPVGAHEHREAAMAVYQAERYRCLAVLVSSYRSHVCCATARRLDDGGSPTEQSAFQLRELFHV